LEEFIEPFLDDLPISLRRKVLGRNTQKKRHGIPLEDSE